MVVSTKLVIHEVIENYLPVALIINGRAWFILFFSFCAALKQKYLPYIDIHLCFLVWEWCLWCAMCIFFNQNMMYIFEPSLSNIYRRFIPLVLLTFIFQPSLFNMYWWFIHFVFLTLSSNRRLFNTYWTFVLFMLLMSI